MNGEWWLYVEGFSLLREAGCYVCKGEDCKKDKSEKGGFDMYVCIG